MVLGLIIAALLACTCAEESPQSTAREIPRLAPAMPPGEQPAKPRRVAASTMSVGGLTLGSATSADIDAWIDAHQLACTDQPSSHRKSHHYRCEDSGLPPALAARRPGEAQGVLMLVRADEGPVHHVSTSRTHADVAAAIEDYQAAAAAIAKRLGESHRADASPPEPVHFEKPLSRFSTVWRFSDLEVELSLSKMSGTALIVRERWDVPGAASGLAPRATSVGHMPTSGAVPHSPHGIVPTR